VAHLTPKKKIEWAQYQRIEGNNLYKKGDYRAALDVYLTCLVSKTDDEEFVSLVFLPVMNNLAQTCLQLKMYLKAEQFCTMALEEISVIHNDSGAQLVAKLYFRRGRARRLSGEYAQARQDLESALLLLLEDDDSTEKKAVKREFQLVQRAEREGCRNQKRQERAMKQILGGRVDTTITPDEKQAGHFNPGSIASSLKSCSGLYQDVRTRRTYSTLTAKRKCKVETDENVSYWRWYLSAVGRVAERLLVLLGDEEYEKRRKQDEEADSSHLKRD
jgi:tetratricopeptide (TPR) repeat protein